MLQETMLRSLQWTEPWRVRKFGFKLWALGNSLLFWSLNTYVFQMGQLLGDLKETPRLARQGDSKPTNRLEVKDQGSGALSSDSGFLS